MLIHQAITHYFSCLAIKKFGSGKSYFYKFILILMLYLDGRGVGFLRYFQVKQLPNFLLASPILSLTLCSIVHYAKLKPEIFFSLGFCAPPEHKDSAAVFLSLAENSSNSWGITSKRHWSVIH